MSGNDEDKKVERTHTQFVCRGMYSAQYVMCYAMYAVRTPMRERVRGSYGKYFNLKCSS